MIWAAGTSLQKLPGHYNMLPLGVAVEAGVSATASGGGALSLKQHPIICARRQRKERFIMRSATTKTGSGRHRSFTGIGALGGFRIIPPISGINLEDAMVGLSFSISRSARGFATLRIPGTNAEQNSQQNKVNPFCKSIHKSVESPIEPGHSCTRDQPFSGQFRPSFPTVVCGSRRSYGKSGKAAVGETTGAW